MNETFEANHTIKDFFFFFFSNEKSVFFCRGELNHGFPDETRNVPSAENSTMKFPDSLFCALQYFTRTHQGEGIRLGLVPVKLLSAESI